MKVSQSTASDEWDGREAAAACVIRQWDVLSKGVLVAALQHAPPYHLIVVKFSSIVFTILNSEPVILNGSHYLNRPMTRHSLYRYNLLARVQLRTDGDSS